MGLMLTATRIPPLGDGDMDSLIRLIYINTPIADIIATADITAIADITATADITAIVADTEARTAVILTLPEAATVTPMAVVPGSAPIIAAAHVVSLGAAEVWAGTAVSAAVTA